MPPSQLFVPSSSMRTASSKYKAKHVFYDSKTRSVISACSTDIYRVNGKLKLPSHIWRFDSIHEFKVYLELTRMYGVDRIARQHKLEIIPSGCCYPKSKDWRVDFAILNSSRFGGCSHFIEAKGAFLPEFATTLACLEQNNEYAFEKLYLVFPGKPPTTNRVLNSLMKTYFANHIFTLKELQHKQDI